MLRLVELVSFTNGTLWDSPTKMASYRWPRYYKGERSTILLIVMFEYIIMPTRFYPKGNLIRELDTCKYIQAAICLPST